jgi:phosphocarrier protein
VIVGSKSGLQGRAAARFVEAAGAASVAITLARPEEPPVSARSAHAVLGLGIRQGDEVVLASPIVGAAAEAALGELADLLARDLDGPA